MPKGSNPVWVMRRMVMGLWILPLLAGCGGKSLSRDGANNGDRGGDTGRGGSEARGGSGATGRGGTAAGSASTSGTNAGGSATGGSTSATVSVLPRTRVDKVDLLFMIDNSISMGDKQRLLADAVPVLVQRLVDPACVDANGEPTGRTVSNGCDASSAPEFVPLEDVHVGIISSSLGNHGGEVCVSDPNENPPRALNDGAELLPSVRSGLYSYENRGFLVWDPRAARPAPDPHPRVSTHETDVAEFVTDFASHVRATGERGCGYEASLEAWYRFLIDPEPIREVTVVNSTNQRGPVNPIVLQQRAAFLRPDSLLGIVMLTDENDCSINDENGRQGWLVGRRSPMPRGSDACAHPEDPDVYRCCIPCVLLESSGSVPPGCNYEADAACNAGHSLPLAEDSTNLRCYDQVRRFGVDLLYPWQRYVDALTALRLPLRTPDAAGRTEVPNPIYTPGADGTPARTPALVFLAGIVGVPWQDLADPASFTGRRLRYLNSREMHASSPNRWDVILGDPEAGVPPLDPFMSESVVERPTGAVNPVAEANAAITPSSGQGARNPINGHEQNIENQDDLQYACTFDLIPDVPCTMSNQDACDCNALERSYNRPICQYVSEGDGVQTHAKAYPGIRHLQVLRGMGDNAVVASICPKNTDASGGPAADPDYGYNPAVASLVRAFKGALSLPCLPRQLPVDGEGNLACTVIEARLPDEAGCSCSAAGRAELSSNSVRSFVESELSLRNHCGDVTGIDCSNYCLCEIVELTGAEGDECRNFAGEAMGSGYCYVDPDRGFGNPELVGSCPDGWRQLIRFVGDGVPASRSVALVTCDAEAG